MGYLRKYLQQVGLVSTLLIGGVLGGLMAPLPSDAAPELVLQVDDLPTTIPTGGTVPGTSILGAPVACNDTSFNACYAINTNVTVTGNGRTYRVIQAAGATARLRVGDFAGQDIFSLIGVRFVPTVTNWGNTSPSFANTNEEHILKITMKNKFNGPLNVDNATGVVVGTAPAVGKVAYGIRSGGEFHSAPLAVLPATTLFCGTVVVNGTVTPVKCNTVGNKVEFTGKGVFIDGTPAVDILSAGAPTANNSLPLSLTVGAGSATTNIVNYNGSSNATLGQVNPTYPQFDCRDGAPGTPNGSKCQPEITLTMKVTLKGPDAFVLVNGGDGICAICNAVDNSKITSLLTKLTKARDLLVLIERFHPSAFLLAIIGEINKFLNNFNTTLDTSCPQGAKYIETIMNLFEVIDQIAFVASGSVPADIVPLSTITINKSVCTEVSCTGLTPVQFAFSINTGDTSIVANVTTDTAGHGTTIVPVPAGLYNVIETPQQGWTLTHSYCNVEDNTNGVTVSVGSNVTCNFTNLPATDSHLGIRLTWGAAPSDLDSHLYIPNGYEVFYSAKGSLVSSPYAGLDLDDVTGFGPENITVVKRMRGTYQYFVHNFSGTFSPGMTGSPARVELIRNGGTTTYVPPPEGEGTSRYWHVFNVVVNSDCGVSIEPVNVWSTSPPTRITTTTTENLCP